MQGFGLLEDQVGQLVGTSVASCKRETKLRASSELVVAVART